MDENTKLIKSVIILNVITLATVIVLLGLQVYQMATVEPSVKTPIDQQKQSTQKTSDSTNTSQNQQQIQQGTAPVQQQSGTMPMGGSQQMPSGQQPNGIQSEKCGDGICDALEKANPNLCAKDCGTAK